MALFAVPALFGLAGCGGCGGGKSQDSGAVSGRFPVQITTAQFPNRQRLAQRSELHLGVKNIGHGVIPNLAITIFTDPNADRPFAVRANIPNAANPNRPVWILENGWPKLAGSAAASGGATTANNSTFQFGSLAPGQTKDMVWLLTPVRPGTYTVAYSVAGDLVGKAVVINADGTRAGGRFLVKINGSPPAAVVGKNGNVVVIGPGGKKIVEKSGTGATGATGSSGATQP